MIRIKWITEWIIKWISCFIIGIISMMPLSFPVFSQTAVSIAPASPAPVIDGKINEKAWQKAVSFSGFKTIAPDLGLEPSERTLVYITHDQNHLYFAIKGFDRDGSRIKASITKRDNLDKDDWVVIELDPFNDAQSNYMFMVNPLGIQSDGMVDQDGRDDLSMDMVWYSKGRLTGEGYEVEIAIPVTSLRLPHKKEVVMGMGIRRSISRKSEQLSFPEYDPGKGSRLIQRQRISITGLKYNRTVQLMPAVTAGGNRKLSAGSWETGNRFRDIGITAKMGLTPTLTLDATVNPDFSHVESDAGQIDVNLRNALFYPEKRPFFLEGKENFKIAGTTAGYNHALGAIVNTRAIVEPALGLKVNGKISSKNMISGIFAVDQHPEGKNAIFSVFRYKRSLYQDSFIGGFYTGRFHEGNYNQVIGADGRFRVKGKSRVEFHAFGSFNRHSDNKLGTAATLEYLFDSRKLDINIGVKHVSKDFLTSTGYLRRTGVTRIPVEFFFSWYPKSKFLQRINYLLVTKQTLDHYSNLWETMNYTGFEFYFPRQTWIWFGCNLKSEVFAGQRFNISDFGGGIFSQILKQLYFNITFDYGNRLFYDPLTPFGGTGLNTSAVLTFQPTDKFRTGLELSYSDFFTKIDKKKIYDYSIIRNHTTFQFNKYLYLRGILEYNSYYKRLGGDLLASFTYIPGTVIQLGYGSVYEKLRWNPGERRYTPANHFQHTGKSFFFKASYLWRL